MKKIEAATADQKPKLQEMPTTRSGLGSPIVQDLSNPRKTVSVRGGKKKKSRNTKKKGRKAKKVEILRSVEESSNQEKRNKRKRNLPPVVVREAIGIIWCCK